MVPMKKTKFVIIAVMFGIALLTAPIVSASAIPFGNSMIKTDSEFSGNAVYNETIDLKWSVGTDTYEWKQSSMYSNTTGHKAQSVLNFRNENGSLIWSLQRNGYNLPSQAPVNQYIDEHTFVNRQFRIPYPAVPYMPGIQLI